MSKAEAERIKDFIRRVQLAIDGFARGEHVSTWVVQEHLKEAIAIAAALEAMDKGQREKDAEIAGDRQRWGRTVHEQEMCTEIAAAILAQDKEK
jgi:hypothetical protein